MDTELDEEIADVSDEIRRYPTPIARCDEQLTELLDRRALLLAEKRKTKTGDRPRFSPSFDASAPYREYGKRGLSPVFAERVPTPGCSPDNIWINDGGFNAA